MKPPDAQSIHTGPGLPDWPRLKRIQEWLKLNGIDPRLVAVSRPVYVLPVQNGTIQGGVPWLIDVIVFHEYYENPGGHREQNMITREAVMYQRTVPLIVPFPAEPTTADEGTRHGETDRQATEEAPEDRVRDQEQAGVPDPRQGARESGTFKSPTARNESAEKGRSSSGDQAVPEPQEDRRGPEEEVGGA